MCTIGFQGMGYSLRFVENYQEIALTLQAKPESLIQIVAKHDSICNACPHIMAITGCKDHTKVDQIDKRHMEILDLEIGEQITWVKARQIIKDKMSPEKFDYACETCEWKSYGVCLDALERLKVS
jgi:hypothetical protein